MTYHVGHYINGQVIQAGIEHPITNPATAEVIGHVNFADRAVVEQAIDAAAKAFPAWAATPPAKRAKVLFHFKALLEAQIDDIATVVTKEHGKTLADARGSILRGIELLDFACGIPGLLRGTHSENVAKGVDCYTLRQPLGVCAAVSPFNFPVMVPIWQFAWAIACGNTFVLKPSEQDPGASLHLAKLLSEAGCPPGVLNVIQGDKTAVDALLQSEQVQAITAVASTPVARSIYQTAIEKGKRAHTFGGAKNHCILMPDADLDEASNAILSAAYGSAGERCMALSVAVVVGDKTADKLVAHFRTKIPSIKIGSGDEEGVEMGPLISRAHLERVQSYVELGIQEGADLVIDNRDCDVPNYAEGFFMGPCLFDHVTSNMRIYQEEIFGPVLVIVRVADFDSALHLINEHEYGNGTAIFTRDGDLARTFASSVQVGMVGINVPIPVPVAYHSFGGWKHSVFGDVAMHGEQSIQFYTKLKSITSRWPKGQYASAEYAMPS